MTDVDTGNLVPAPTATAVLDHVVRALVDDPDSVTIEGIEGRRGITLEVRVAPGDMGRLIGQMIEAGVFVDGQGLGSSARGVRMNFAGGKRTIQRAAKVGYDKAQKFDGEEE